MPWACLWFVERLREPVSSMADFSDWDSSRFWIRTYFLSFIFLFLSYFFDWLTKSLLLYIGMALGCNDSSNSSSWMMVMDFSDFPLVLLSGDFILFDGTLCGDWTLDSSLMNALEFWNEGGSILLLPYLRVFFLYDCSIDGAISSVFWKLSSSLEASSLSERDEELE